MSRGFIIILILQLGFFIHGCTTLEYIDGSSEEEIKKFKMAGYGMRNEMEKVRAENVNLQRQIDILNILGKEKQRIIDENENEIARMRGDNELLNEEIKKLKSENQRVKYENKSLVKILTRQKETLSSKSHALEKDIQKLNIKVISRDSKNSAKEMAKKLKEMGYNIKSIGYAPRSKFLRNTVYFAPEFKTEAKYLVFSLGDNTMLKPLNWPSVFDLIVVIGKNP